MYCAPGAFALAKVIFSSTGVLDHLRHLYIANNAISAKGRAAINKAVSKLGRITVVYD